jgi:FkbM family methyltransferase
MKLRKFIGKAYVPLASWIWQYIHPPFVRRFGVNFLVDSKVVPYYITRKSSFRRLLPIFDYYLSNGKTLIDIGASFGFYSLFSAKKGAKVIAFEPTSRSCNLLLRNLRENGLNIILHQVALGSLIGEAKLYHGRCFGSNSLNGSGRYEKVPIQVLDDYKLQPDLVKIDVEGRELDVLQGMKNTLKGRPALLIEISQDYAAIKELLRKKKYSFVLSIGHNYLAMPAGGSFDGLVELLKKKGVVFRML